MSVIDVIWIEANGCSGNIISFLNTDEPSVHYILKEIINITFSNAVVAEQGEGAWENFLNTLKKDFILIVEGAIPLKDNGLYTIVATYKGEQITAKKAVELAAPNAKTIFAVGTCASFGGISAAVPNPSQCISLPEFLSNYRVIRLPGCPCNPRWLAGTLFHLLYKGYPDLDNLNRPIMYYGRTIHDRCPRRGDFDEGNFAKSFGEKGCLFNLGCKGPFTKTDCPVEKWNSHENWPVGVNSNCIGCASPAFPDGTEPFKKEDSSG